MWLPEFSTQMEITTTVRQRRPKNFQLFLKTKTPLPIAGEVWQVFRRRLLRNQLAHQRLLFLQLSFRERDLAAREFVQLDLFDANGR